MKKYANVGSDGTGVVENPNPKNVPLMGCENSYYNEFADQHPPLKVYNKSNELVRNCRVEVELQHQYEPQDEEYLEWRNCSASFYEAMNRKNNKYPFRPQTPARQIYLAVEAGKPDNWEDSTFMLPATPISQPVKEVKINWPEIARWLFNRV